MQISSKTQKPAQSSSLPTVTPPAAGPLSQTAAPQAQKPAAGLNTASSFTSAPKAKVALSAEPQKATGPLELSSPQAQAAIQKTVDFVQEKANRGLVPGVDASQALAPVSVEHDALGMTHVRMDRQHEGVKVFGEQVIGHLDREGKVESLTGNVGALAKGLGSAPTKLSSQDALALAQKQFSGKTDREPTAERVIFQGKDGQYHAAYHVELTNTSDLKAEDRPQRMNYLIDANSGEMLTQYNQMGGIELPQGKGAAAPKAGTPASTPKASTPGTQPATGKADDTTLYSGKVDLSTQKNADGTYSLEDSTRGKGVVTVDAQNKSQAGKVLPITDKNDVWGESTDPSRNKSAVDAHYGAEMTYDFIKDVLGRDSLDGKGEKLVSNVHIGTNYVNAYWDGKQMNYGDGDGKQSGPLTTLDIAGHEIAHGLTERTAGLIYDGESGGLNEAFSDIMGTGVEWYASQKNQAVEFDWKMGEDAWTPANGTGDALRYMDDPTKDGYSIDHYKNYPKQTEVHGSSGIANNAFYLLVNGGTNRTSKAEVKDGIGMEKGLQVYYRALAHYMTPNTTFAQARAATLKAATDLYGANSTEAKKVAESWSAVGVN
ncbi:M4 family metallopeptidase [Stigmatella aurantiaca]|uniref:Neutral metalloproteinase n=1 Tax=Stigmatella aurantiaca (strain DW4/3-1) TaxID=378806 RepID=Q08Q43_STIAD|nr:M4 family metallopeptidase [Stigmatella aurantiaca]ADO74914.1 Peptidase, M4 (Thermolysin) family [Stigmatella aurantiaca DW4/3-1]EAU62602.1 neutral protease A [Stigmatella aurantiaca DW4/3-1]